MDHRTYRRHVAHVGPYAVRPLGGELERRGNRVGDIGEHDPRALGEEASPVRQADAGGAAGDHRDCAREPHVARA